MSDSQRGQVNITATVERVSFRNAQNGFCVVEMGGRDDFFTAVGILPEVAAGEELNLTGEWTTHATFGRQLKILSFSRSLPDTAAKLFSYLASGAIKGVGPKLAMRIIERFGERTFDILENEPDREAILRGEVRFDAEGARRIMPKLHFLPNTQWGYAPCLCGRACDRACYEHLKSLEGGKTE